MGNTPVTASDEYSERIELYCQPVQISQILVNLLSNAFDAVMSSPGASSERWVEISASDDADAHSLLVTDSGPGVPVEMRKRIFDPFFTSKPVGVGTGLGLSVSKGIAEAHGGRLFLDEASPRSRFVLRIPRQHRPKGGIDAAESPGA